MYALILTLINNLIKNITMPTSHNPLVLTFLDAGDVNITNTLFGVSSVTVPNASWTVTANSVENNANIVFGTALVNYSNPLFVRLATSDNIEISKSSIDLILVATETEVILYPGGVEYTLTVGTDKLSNWILNFLFKNVTTFPSVFYASLVNSVSTEISRYALTPANWSEVYTGVIGEKYYEYGETKSIILTGNHYLKTVNIGEGAVSGTIWFTLDITLPAAFRNGSIVFSDSFILRVPDATINQLTYLKPTNANSFIHLDFNGRFDDVSETLSLATQASTAFVSTPRLFGTECLELGTTAIVSYAFNGANIPNLFTLNAFFNLQTSPTGRAITFFEKIGVIKLQKSAANNLILTINSTAVLTVPWTPVANSWQHIWIQKTATDVFLRVNAGDINTSTPYVIALATNVNNLTVNNLLEPIIGVSNGIYLLSGAVAFAANTKPLAKEAYSWSDVHLYNWLNISPTQLQEYFR